MQDRAIQDRATQDRATQDPALLHRLATTPDNATLAGGQIRLDVLVVDAAGKPVPGLAVGDFTVLADKAPQKLVSFEGYGPGADRPEQPVELIIVIDAVDNGFSELALMRQGLERFLHQNGGRLAHPTSLILFTVDGVQALAPPSTDGNALADLVKQIKPHVRAPGIDPFTLAVPALAHIAEDEAKVEGRKLLVWLGPGWEPPAPNPGAMTPRDEQYRKNYFQYGILLSTRLRQARAVLYGGYQDSAFYDRAFLKGVRKLNDEDPRDLSLSVLALQSGGRGGLAHINRDSDVADQLNSFAAEADAFYTLSFDPPADDAAGTYRDLKVVIDKPGLTARTNTGFYSEAAPTPAQPALGQATASKPDLAPANAFVGKPVTVQELEKLVNEDAKKRDGAAARDLYDLRLTERLSTARLTALEAALPGAKARQALVALADGSAFLALPATEIPATPAPTLVEQRRIVALSIEYLRTTMPRLPNFYATRTTNRYEDTREDPSDPRILIASGDPLHWASASAATVIYRDHREVVDTGETSAKKAKAQDRGLVTRGTFGPILSTVMIDAAHGEMGFGHWEDAGPEATPARALAVFHFAVPQEHSHYEVAYQSDPAAGASYGQRYDIDRPAAYHGEIAIDPATGAILRLALIADVEPGLSITHADIMVEYGPVEIGSKMYICPVRSVSLSVGRAVTTVRTLLGTGDTLGPSITRLNDVAFSNYHIFRTEMRIITDEPGPAQP